jgi:putative transposase
MSRAASPFAGRLYGAVRVTREGEMARSSFYDRRGGGPACATRSAAGRRQAGIRNRHDHGSQYLSDDYQAEIAFLGMESSPAFVRQPEGNGCVERFIRTLKERLLWRRTFRTVEELQQALAEFRERYNRRWIVQRLDYLTPAQARQQLLALGAAA